SGVETPAEGQEIKDAEESNASQNESNAKSIVASSTPPLEMDHWVVFLCPPYIMWEEQTQALFDTIEHVQSTMPQGSVIVCESEVHWPAEGMPGDAQRWDIRERGNVRLAFYD
ncbi:MAG: hypothetical protein AAFP90_13105, partial [Planctomycetota bacterium]